SRNTSPFSFGDGHLEIVGYFFEDVFAESLLLHRGGLTSHVHKHQRDLGARYNVRQSRGISQRADVVYDYHALVNRRFLYSMLVSINRERKDTKEYSL